MQPTSPLLMVLLALAAATTRIDAGCRFPRNFQTNRTTGGGGEDRAPRDWVGKVRDQFSDVGIRIEIAGNVMRVTSSDGRSWRSYTAVCLQVVLGDRYLLAYEETGQRLARYSCVQFVRRSVDVFQTRAAAVSTRMDRAMCQDAALVTDDWLVFDRANLGRQRVPCPLHGGYSVHLFDKSRQKGVCDAYRGETRVESECERGDGFVFRFRRTTCVPADMYMYSRQPTVCVAGWTTGRPGDDSVRSYRFTLLRHNEPRHSYYWLLRTPLTEDRRGFSAVLFNDLVADTTSLVNSTRNYIRVDMRQDDDVDRTALCSDEYEICWDRQMNVERRCRRGLDAGSGAASTGSWADLALTCPRTCGLCDDASPAACRLPEAWRGSWVDGAGGSAVVINETAMKFDDGGLAMSCVRWRTDGEGDDGTTMFVTVYGRGCRPRYRCARILRQTASLLYVQFSDAASWPLVRSPFDPVNCSRFNFEHWSTVQPPAVSGSATGSSSTRGFLLALVNGDGSVDCRLPADVALVEYAVEFDVDGARSSERCSGTLTADSGRSLTLTVSGCGSGVRRRFADTSYTCVDSFRASPLGDQLVVITRTGASPPIVFCWLFTRGIRRSFYLLSGTQCHQAVAGRSHRQIEHVAFFRQPRSSTSAVVMLTTTTTPRRPVTPTATVPSGPVSTRTASRPTVNRTNVEEEDEELDSFSDAFVVGVAAVVFAVIEAILLCRC